MLERPASRRAAGALRAREFRWRRKNGLVPYKINAHEHDLAAA